MIEIAICDDDWGIREVLRKHIVEYEIKNRVEFKIKEYENGTKLLASEKEHDLVFMDYEFKNDEENNGLTIAKRLRTKYRNSTIIFLSGYGEIVYIEAKGKHCLIHLASAQTVEVLEMLFSIEKSFQKSCFTDAINPISLDWLM